MHREEVARMFAEIASGIGRDPALHAAEVQSTPINSVIPSMGAGDILYPSHADVGGATCMLTCMHAHRKFLRDTHTESHVPTRGPPRKGLRTSC
eukprot:358796-Chlamydomonas_euryale.AAC.16